MGMSANSGSGIPSGETPGGLSQAYGQALGMDGDVPVYRLPQNLPGILQQDATSPGSLASQASGGSYGQLNGMPTIRPYPFQDPRFQFDNFQLTPLRTQKPKVPKPPPPVLTQVRKQNKNRQSDLRQQNKLEQEQIQRDNERAARIREIQSGRH